MPPDRGRAGRACTSCRKQKTRCYAPERQGAPCLRCETLHHVCSFTFQLSSRGDTSTNDCDRSQLGNRNSATTDDRLSRLESAVNTLLDRFGDIAARSTRSSTPLRTPHRGGHVHRSPARGSLGPSADGDDAIAPVFVLRDLTAEQRGHAIETKRPGQDDIIDEGLISQHNAISLISIFQEHYGRWVAFDSTVSPELLLGHVRASPLLLCACCLIAIRHLSVEAAGNIAPKLFEKTKSLLSRALLVTPQGLEFFQAAIILCMWSTTVGQTPLSIDSWLLSGFALQHCLSTSLFEPIVSHHQSSNRARHSLDKWGLWNHLCLVHLHYCVGTRRRSMIGQPQVDRCREILNSDHATNFESRMVSEINLYWIIYEHSSATKLDLPKAQAALHEWKRKWTFVLEQPRSQFLEMGFHFAQLLAYECSLKAKSARVRDSLLSEMVRLSAAIIRLAMDTADERTRHLSDHIYHMITFAAITLCRLLYLYELQLSVSHDIAELDSLILKAIDWLHSIGLACHAGHTLGNTIATFHRKLRPRAQPTMHSMMDPTSNWMGTPGLDFLPELLDTGVSPGGNWNFLPDWEPFYQGPLT